MKIEAVKGIESTPIEISVIRFTLDNGDEFRVKLFTDCLIVNKYSENTDGMIISPCVTNEIKIS